MDFTSTLFINDLFKKMHLEGDFMKKRIIWILIVLSIVMVIGCSSENKRADINKGQRDAASEENRRLGAGGLGDTGEEEIQEMFKERQQNAIEACNGKTEGDGCEFENPRGAVSAICKRMEGNLVCISDRPMRQRE